MNYLIKALVAKLEGEIEVAKANILVYVRSPVGIGEHGEVVQTIEQEIAKIAEAEDKLEVCKKHFGK